MDVASIKRNGESARIRENTPASFPYQDLAAELVANGFKRVSARMIGRLAELGEALDRKGAEKVSLGLVFLKASYFKQGSDGMLRIINSNSATDADKVSAGLALAALQKADCNFVGDRRRRKSVAAGNPESSPVPPLRQFKPREPEPANQVNAVAAAPVIENIPIDQ